MEYQAWLFPLIDDKNAPNAPIILESCPCMGVFLLSDRCKKNFSILFISFFSAFIILAWWHDYLYIGTPV